jgi:hypothetical protein
VVLQWGTRPPKDDSSEGKDDEGNDRKSEGKNDKKEPLVVSGG